MTSPASYRPKYVCIEGLLAAMLHLKDGAERAMPISSGPLSHREGAEHVKFFHSHIIEWFVRFPLVMYALLLFFGGATISILRYAICLSRKILRHACW